MKKLLSVVFAFVLIFSCFAVCAFAEDVAISPDKDYDYWGAIYYETQPVMTLSDDYKKLYVDGESYSRFNTAMLETDFGYTVFVEEKHNPYSHTGAYVDFTDEQASEINQIYIETNYLKNMYRIEIYFNDGTMLTLYFLLDTYFDEYNEIIKGNANEYFVDFDYPEGNIVTAQKDALFGEIVTLSENELSNWYSVFSVTVKNSDGSLMAYTGDVTEINDEFYYVDYKESGVDESPFYNQVNVALSDCIFHKITDEKLVADLKLALEKYYGDDYNVLYDDNTTDTISAVFLIFVFAVVPFVIFVIFLVKAIRGKGIYKKLYGAVSAVCIAEIIVFVILAFILTSAKPSSDSITGGSDDAGYIQIETDIDFDNGDLYL